MTLLRRFSALRIAATVGDTGVGELLFKERAKSIAKKQHDDTNVALRSVYCLIAKLHSVFKPITLFSLKMTR